MAERYPLFLDMQSRRCLIVGGGAVAARKAHLLLACGAEVLVVAPDAVAGISERAAVGELTWAQREFRAADVAGKELVFAATSAPRVNQQVLRAARQQGVWTNVVDDPDGSDFHVPAVLRRGALTVAVATAGGSPVLAAWIRDRIDRELPAELATLAELASSLRRATGAGAECFRTLFESGVLADLCRRDHEVVGRKVKECFGDGEAVRRVLQGFGPEG